MSNPAFTRDIDTKYSWALLQSHHAWFKIRVKMRPKRSDARNLFEREYSNNTSSSYRQTVFLLLSLETLRNIYRQPQHNVSITP